MLNGEYSNIHLHMYEYDPDNTDFDVNQAS